MPIKKVTQQQEVAPTTKAKIKDQLKPGKAKQAFGVKLNDQQANTVLALAVVSKKIDDLNLRQLSNEKEGYRKELVSLCEGQPTDKPVVLETDEAAVTFSACQNSKKITDMHGLIGALKDKLGYEGLLEILNVTMTDAEKYLAPHELSPFIDTVPGSRTLKSAVIKG